MERRLTLNVDTSLRDTVTFLGMITVAFVPRRRPSDHVSFEFQLPERTTNQSCLNCRMRREVKCSRSYIGQLGFSASVADFSLPFSRHSYHDRGIFMSLKKTDILTCGGN